MFSFKIKHKSARPGIIREKNEKKLMSWAETVRAVGGGKGDGGGGRGICMESAVPSHFNSRAGIMENQRAEYTVIESVTALPSRASIGVAANRRKTQKTFLYIRIYKLEMYLPYPSNIHLLLYDPRGSEARRKGLGFPSPGDAALNSPFKIVRRCWGSARKTGKKIQNFR